MTHNEPHGYRLLPVFTGLFVACLLISNVANVAKFLQLGPLVVAGGTLVFPVSFIFGDVLTEVYGYAQSRKVIWTGFASLIFMSLFLLLLGWLPAADFWQNQSAFDSIFGAVPRIIIASMTAYSCGEFCNSFVLSKMKYRAHGKRGFSQAWRFIASTLVGEAVDTIVFFSVALLGTLPATDILQAMMGAYIIKVAIEIIMTPLSTRFSNWVKKVEHVDHIDTPAQTSYNPFAVGV